MKGLLFNESLYEVLELKIIDVLRKWLSVYNISTFHLFTNVL